MKTAFYLICTAFLSTGIYLAALNSKNATPGILLAMGVWAWFFWCWHRRNRKAAERRERERLLEEWLRRMHDGHHL